MTTQELIDRLDKQYPSWDLYRTAMREWAVTVEVEKPKTSETEVIRSKS